MERDGRGIPTEQQRRVSRRVATQQSHADDYSTATSRATTSRTNSSIYNDSMANRNDDSGLNRYNNNKKYKLLQQQSNNASYSHAIDFSRIDMRSLLRYKRYYKLPIPCNASKYQLIDVVRKHFNKPLLIIPNKDNTGNIISTPLLSPSTAHEHNGSIMPNGNQLTEPDILAGFLHVSHRFIKLKQQAKQQQRDAQLPQ